MSNNDFDRAVNFLQGALDVAVSESKAEQGPLLPGFEEPPQDTSREEPQDREENAPATAGEADGERPPEGRRHACSCRVKIFAGLAMAAVFGVSAAVTFRLVCPRIVVRTVTVEKEVPLEPDGIPLALLPDTADPDLWETVADMTGEIDGTHLSFKRGIATANGTVYKAVLDFCRGGDRIYARVDGPKRYVVCLDGQGRIVKTYRAPGNNKPLKAIFGK